MSDIDKELKESTHNLKIDIASWLKLRQDMITKFNALLNLLPYEQQQKTQSELLDNFCNQLFLYVSEGHESFFSVLLNSKNSKVKLKSKMYILRSLVASTNYCLNFYQKYSGEQLINDETRLTELKSDLGLLGEHLANRMEQEDLLVELAA